MGKFLTAMLAIFTIGAFAFALSQIARTSHQLTDTKTALTTAKDEREIALLQVQNLENQLQEAQIDLTNNQKDKVLLLNEYQEEQMRVATLQNEVATLRALTMLSMQKADPLFMSGFALQEAQVWRALREPKAQVEIVGEDVKVTFPDLYLLLKDPNRGTITTVKFLQKDYVLRSVETRLR